MKFTLIKFYIIVFVIKHILLTFIGLISYRQNTQKLTAHFSTTDILFNFLETEHTNLFGVCNYNEQKESGLSFICR